MFNVSRRLRRTLRLRRPHRPPVGAPPGTLHISPDEPPPRIDVIAFDHEDDASFLSREDVSVEEVRGVLDDETYDVRWIRVHGVGDAEVVQALGEAFGLHKVSLEDVVHRDQRPRIELFEDHFFVVMRPVRLSDEDAHGPVHVHLETDQVSLFVGKGWVLTFEPHGRNILGPVSERVRSPSATMRQSAEHYLGYAVMDTVLDSYFPVVDMLSATLEALEYELIREKSTLPRSLLRHLHEVKSEFLVLHRAVYPLRDVALQLMRERKFMPIEEAPYLRDWSEHVDRIVDGVRLGRDTGDGLMDTYLSLAQHRMNEVVKVLTMIATIFIPLSFVAGLYGMNFDPEVSQWNMPELSWRYGYPYALGIMAFLTLLMLALFARLGWLRLRRHSPYELGEALGGHSPSARRSSSRSGR